MCVGASGDGLVDAVTRRIWKPSGYGNPPDMGTSRTSKLAGYGNPPLDMETVFFFNGGDLVFVSRCSAGANRRIHIITTKYFLFFILRYDVFGNDYVYDRDECCLE